MGRSRLPRPSRSPFERDIEVATFLRSILPTRTYPEAIDECRARFGQQRTPSTSAMNRFAERFHRSQQTKTVE